MIELRNVKKIYKSKSGAETVALDDINLKFGNTGMLFIVGKSGSGKSTLLNLLGGLDSSTSGDILINDKSISVFDKKQYDSYRNTYVGFIFQEFNILEQYNVYENIELAVKLQDQDVLKEDIDALLDRLGLNGLGQRKINELSGGQKQRVAIARALIKKPKIILADEPTGNLDSASSEQIFNILKGISKEQLVVVVSHDMESAVKYGDRIVKIEDGKIVEDSNSIEELSDETFELKKSKLPFSYALKMAVTSFKAKPGKLFMTVLLTAMALIFMGFSVNCLLFDEVMLITNTMRDNNDYVYDVIKMEYKVDGSVSSLILDNDDLREIRDITNSKLNYAYSLYDKGESLNFLFGEQEEQHWFYNYTMGQFRFIEVENEKILGKLIGRAPEKENEIVVHKYFADYAIKYGIMVSDNNLYFPESYEDFVNSKKELKLGENKVIVVGIVNDDDSLFLDAKEGKSFETEELKTFFNENYSEKGSDIYVKGFSDSAILRTDKMSLLNNAVIRDSSYQKYVSNMIIALINDVDIITGNGITKINSLEKNQVILSIEAFKKFDSRFDIEFNKYLVEHSSGTYEESLKNFTSNFLKENTSDIRTCLNIYARDYEYKDTCSSLNVIGVSMDDNNYISYKYVEDYEPQAKMIYSVRVYNDDTSDLRSAFSKMVFSDFTDGMEAGVYYNFLLDNDNEIVNVIVAYRGLAIYILIVSLVFVLFSFLLFSNFISTSVSYCKKEIGILRALGARNIDIIKIFGYESFIIGILSWALSIMGWFIVCAFLNASLFGDVYFVLNGIVTHPLIPGIMFVYTMFIALFVTVVSISRITRIKPIEAILNK